MALLAKAEIDQQIATAHAFPRSVKAFLDKAMTLATLDAETAISCVYALPRGNTPIKGASIRFAEILASCWGNIRIGSRIVKIGRTHVTAQGVCHDLECNQVQTAEIERRITTKNGKRYNDDMIGVTCNAAASIAKRNAILAVIPKALWKSIYEAAMNTAFGGAKSIVERRSIAFELFAKRGVIEQRVLWALGKPALDDVDAEDLETLLGWHTALKENETPIEQIFPLTDPALEPAAEPAGKGADALVSKLGGDAKQKDDLAELRKKKAAEKEAAEAEQFGGDLSEEEKQQIMDEEAAAAEAEAATNGRTLD